MAKFEEVARELDLYEFIGEYERAEIEDGIRAVDAVEGGWEFLRDYEVHPMKGFMFADPQPVLDQIGSKMRAGHSGSSYAKTMRCLQFIAKYGVREYRLATGWSTSWDMPPSGAHFLYSDGRAAEQYRNKLTYLTPEELKRYETLLPEKLLKLYPSDTQQDKRDELMRQFQTAKSAL
jgi:hypothetical protein